MHQGPAIVQWTEMRRHRLGTILQRSSEQKIPDVAVQHVGGGPESIGVFEQEHHRPHRILLGKSRLHIATTPERRFEQRRAPTPFLALAPFPNRFAFEERYRRNTFSAPLLPPTMHCRTSRVWKP